MDFVIHELLKDVNGPIKERYRESLIPPTDEERSFVGEVTQLFRRHHSGRIYGNFEPDTVSYPLSKLVKDCQSDGNFLKFSIQAASLLVSKMKAIPAATGGYFFAARFTHEGEDLLLVFMLSQRQSHAVDPETLSLRKSVNLQMDHLDLAARINIAELEDGRPEPVSLVRGRKEVSDYFKSFIGLHEPRTNTEATQGLKQFTERWMEGNSYSQDRRETVRERIVEYARKRGGDPIELNVVATIVDEARYQEFFDKANESGLGAEFHIDRRSLKAWERVVYSEPGGDIRLNFAKRLLLSKRISYNPEKKTLLIKRIEIPESELM
jgi:nucleoid-associated protein